MLNKLTLMTSSFVMALTLAVPQLSYGTNESQVEEKKSLQSSTEFTDLPLELRMRIQKEVIINGESPDKLSLVNKDWFEYIKQEMQMGETLWNVWPGVKSKKDEEIYKTFINGKLIFKPDYQSEKGMKEFPILDFANPFKGIFDLSECILPEYEDRPASKYLRITTDPATFFKVDVKHEDQRINILIAPHFLIKNLTKRDKKHPFEDIINNWNKDKAPLGMFWRRSGDAGSRRYDYLIDSSLLAMSRNNLFRSRLFAMESSCIRPFVFRPIICFHVHFETKMRIIDNNPR